MDSYIRIWDSGRKALQRCKWSHSQLASYHQNCQCGSCFMLFPMGWDGSEGRRMQFDSRNKYGTWVGKKSSWKNPKNASGKSEGHKWQTGGREKNSSTAAPSALLRVWSMRKCEFMCWLSQFCAPFPAFNENFGTICHGRKIPRIQAFVLPTHNEVSWGTWLV